MFDFVSDHFVIIMIVLHLEHALSTSLWTHLGGNHIPDCNINGTCGGYVMDDGRPLESKGTSHPGLYPAAAAAAAAPET